MSISIKCLAKVKSYVDENFSVGNSYVCEDIGNKYIITDNNGGFHNISKNGQLIKRFEIKEV